MKVWIPIVEGLLSLRAWLLIALLSPLPLCASQMIRVGIYENPPKLFLTSEGAPAGFFIAILDEIAQREAWQLEYTPCHWADCLEKLQQGTIDLMPDVAYSTSRAENFDFNHEVVLSNWSVIYGRKGEPLHSILDLDTKHIAVIRGSAQYEALRSTCHDFAITPSFIEVDEPAAVLDLVLQGKADGGLVNRLFGLRQKRWESLERSHILVKPSRLHFATAKGENAALLNAIDRQLTTMKAERSSSYYHALDRWVTPLEQERLPLWPLWIIEGLAALLLILFLFNHALRRAVRHKQRALADSEAKYRGLYEATEDAILLISGNRIIDCNPATMRLLGYPDRKTILGKTLEELSTLRQEDGTTSARVALQHHLDTVNQQGHAAFTWQLQHVRGEALPVDFMLTSLQLAGKPLLQASARDNRERIHQQETLKRLNRTLQTLSRVNHTLVHAASEVELFDAICRAIIETGGHRFTWIGLFTPEASGRLQPAAHAGHEDGYLEQLDWALDRAPRTEATIAAARSNAPVVIDNIAQLETTHPWKKEALNRGFRSAIAIPLVYGKHRYGVLTIYHDTIKAFGEEERPLQLELAQDLAYGIHTQRLHLAQSER